MFEGIVLNMVKPHLGKIPDGLKSIAKDYGVDKCCLMIDSIEVLEEGNTVEKPIIRFCYLDSEGLHICKDKDGNRAEYPIEKLLSLIAPGS